MKERFTAQMLVDYHASRKGIAVQDIGVAPVVVISWNRRVVQSMADAVGAGPAAWWLHEGHQALFSGQVQGRHVSFVESPIGAPGTVTLMEELVACGARLILGLGWAGSLQPSAPVGTFLIPTSGIREEGTSFHYLEADVDVAPDGRLVELLRATCQAEGAAVLAGPQWTTDAPYRELGSKVEAYSQRGVLGVDMETSAMYALGQFRGIRVCNLLVVSDELWREWRPAFGSAELRVATTRAQQVILRCLENGLGLLD